MKTMIKQRYLHFFLLCIISMSGFGVMTAQAQTSDSLALASLKSVDPGLLPYFPRWSVCEPNLQLQIFQVFKLDGRPAENLDMRTILITSAPIKDPKNPDYNILLIECGKEKMTADQVDSKLKTLVSTLINPKRPYCYQDVPVASAPSQAQIEAITNYLEMPTNTTHSYSLSAFEQTLKIGKEDGYWIRSVIGTEGAGLPFISSGEAKVMVQHPLYVNEDIATRKAIPNLLHFHIGMGYRMQDTSNGMLNFLPQRRLNAAYGGKGIFGFDFHAPFEPNFGITFHVEVPLQGIDTLKTIERATYAAYFKSNPASPRDPLVVAPLLRITGNTGLFYNWWLDPENPENYVRFDLGINYTEVREVAINRLGNDTGPFALNDKVDGLTFFHPTEFLDWLYAKVEYRNQSTFPFGLSAQYSNQIFLGRLYLPLLGEWLYLDARYSIPLRSESRPFDQSVFMISPVLRLNI
ncbi:MAG: hypothetical protein FJ212_02350 [Ignavibacteria bacterium]|nr:hypothetical protein [Ignavibacteria bacterium]